MSDTFRVYCTSNHDGTGACIAQATNEAMTCLLVPGQIVECQGTQEQPSQCILIGQISAQQAELSCQTSLEQTDIRNKGKELSSPFNEDVLYNDYKQVF